jgi:hypothetical protein
MQNVNCACGTSGDAQLAYFPQSVAEVKGGETSLGVLGLGNGSMQHCTTTLKRRPPKCPTGYRIWEKGANNVENVEADCIKNPVKSRVFAKPC